MIIQVEHDDDGNIRSIAGPASTALPDGATGMTVRIPAPGHQIAELETELVRHERDIDGMRQVKDSYQVTGHPREPTLVRRQKRT